MLPILFVTKMAKRLQKAPNVSEIGHFESLQQSVVKSIFSKFFVKTIVIQNEINEVM